MSFTHSPRQADSPQGARGLLADRLYRTVVFLLEAFLYRGPSVPVFRIVRPLLGGQSAIARWTVRSVRSFLPSLFGSFASSLVLPRVR
jgi:hypothetical protein